MLEYIYFQKIKDNLIFKRLSYMSELFHKIIIIGIEES
jgi:hypothetical protein